MPVLSKIKETCLYVTDLQRTCNFYVDVLGLPLISLKEGRHVFFRAGEDVLLCFISEATRSDETLPPHFADGQQHFAFECPAGEYERWKQHLSECGIPIEHEAHWRPGLKSIYFRDPDQHCVEIVMPGLWD